MPPCAQVTLTVPGDAPPGTLLSVPVEGGAEHIKIRVPNGVGPGSTLILTQAEGSEEWGMEIAQAFPVASEEGAVQSAVQSHSGHRAASDATSPVASNSYQP